MNTLDDTYIKGLVVGAKYNIRYIDRPKSYLQNGPYTLIAFGTLAAIVSDKNNVRTCVMLDKYRLEPVKEN